MLCPSSSPLPSPLDAAVVCPLQKRDEWGNMLWPMHQLSMGELGLLFGHFANLDYAIVS